MGSVVSSSIVAIIGSPVAEVTTMISSVEPASKISRCSVARSGWCTYINTRIFTVTFPSNPCFKGF